MWNAIISGTPENKNWILSRLYRNGNWDTRHWGWGSHPLVWSHRIKFFLAAFPSPISYGFSALLELELLYGFSFPRHWPPAPVSTCFVSKMRSLGGPIFELSFIVFQFQIPRKKSSVCPWSNQPWLEWGYHNTPVVGDEAGFLRRDYGW